MLWHLLTCSYIIYQELGTWIGAIGPCTNEFGSVQSSSALIRTLIVKKPKLYNYTI